MRSFPKFIDLFAGAGGLSEGFISNNFQPVVHIEMDENACMTLKTRTAYHYLKENHQERIYQAYLKQQISRKELYSQVPSNLLESVINTEISSRTIDGIFQQIDSTLDGNKVDVIIGGPPCQAYSLIGRSRDPNRMKGDKRNFLFRYYGEFLRKYKPTYFVFENVLGLLSAGNAKYLQDLLKLFGDIGYSADYKILDASDYGVLQKRKRVIIIGRKGLKKFHFPELQTVENHWQVKRDLLNDLPILKPGDDVPVVKYSKPATEYLKRMHLRNGSDYVSQHICRVHNSRDLEIYSIAIEKWINERERLKYDQLPSRLRTHKNIAGFLDRYKVVDPDGHSHTVVAHIAKDGHYYIYPDLKQIRSISVREAARLQSFPDDFYFEGGRSSAFKQIGNAVPPMMAMKIAEGIIQM